MKNMNEAYISRRLKSKVYTKSKVLDLQSNNSKMKMECKEPGTSSKKTWGWKEYRKR